MRHQSSNPTHTSAAKRSFQARHLRSIEDLSDNDIQTIIDLSLFYGGELMAKRPLPEKLKGRTQINLFYEDSTRTNMSFELAGKKLGADAINLPVSASSVNKNEEMIDTVQTLDAMGADAMIVRASTPGIHQFLSEHVNCAIINAGDGAHEHPTQALLDSVTIISETGTIENKRIAICGDIRHSRVVGSDARLFQRLGAEVRFIGPASLMPDVDKFVGIERFDNLKDGLEGCHLVMPLRMQFERMSDKDMVDATTYFQTFGITYRSLEYAREDAKIMHPGPMNRGIEIEGTLADDPARSLILKQVFHGVPTRMAILDALINRGL